ncbi:MAG: VCBS repeat-containing protein, partial [Myxococcota bacterium]
GVCAESWFAEGQALPVEPGRHVVFVQVFSTKSEGVPPYLEGCNADFDTGDSGDGSQRVPVNLQFVLPESARLVLAGSNRLTASPGATPSSGLRVRVLADAPRFQRVTFGIPGIPVRFIPASGAAVGAASPGAALTAETLQEGLVEVPVTVPTEPGVGEVIAEAAIPNIRGSVRFIASALAPIQMESLSARLVGVGVPRAVALGPLEAGGAPHLVVVGCDDGGTEGACPVSGAPEGPPGVTRALILTDLEGPLREVPLDSSELGILPADVFIAPVGPNGSYRAGVVNQRRVDCKDRVCTDPESCPCWTLQSGTPCPCEGAEIRYLSRNGGSVELEGRLTLTASNAIAAAPYTASGARSASRVAVAGQGRSKNERPCAEGNACLEYRDCRTQPELCGCPPEEQCDCPNCGVVPSPRCVARDRMVDMAGFIEDRLVNHLGCQMRRVDCNKGNQTGSCACLDAAKTGARCGGDPGRDACGCTVPRRVRVGPKNATSLPIDVAVGRFDADDDTDMVVGSRAGLELFVGGAETFAWSDRPFLNASIDFVAAANLDPAAEFERGGPPLDDVVWAAQGACTRGVAQEEQCPVIESAPDAGGCFGVYVSDGVSSLFTDVNERAAQRCRRWDLGAAPVGMCLGDFDGSGTVDLALGTEGASHIDVLLGDGWGGVVFPPVEVPLPPEAVTGPMTCGDTDGDGRDEIVVVDRDGDLTLLRTMLP